MRCDYLIFDTLVEKRNDILDILTLVDIQIFNNELLLLSPSYPETLLRKSSLIFLFASLKAVLIQKIVNSFVIDLQEGAEDIDVFTLFFFHSFYFLKHVRHSSVRYTKLLNILSSSKLRGFCNSSPICLLHSFDVFISFHSESFT